MWWRNKKKILELLCLWLDQINSDQLELYEFQLHFKSPIKGNGEKNGGKKKKDWGQRKNDLVFNTLDLDLGSIFPWFEWSYSLTGFNLIETQLPVIKTGSD